MHFLVIKHGALGDVVRTSYFASALRKRHGDKLRLSWITAPTAYPLLRFNPHIDDLWTDFRSAANYCFDRIFSLDDELDVVQSVMELRTARLTGAFLDANGERDYTEDVAAWFDMGLLSHFGKKRADELKVQNQRTHAEIFCEIFDVDGVQPEFWGMPRMEGAGVTLRGGAVASPVIGINPYAGGRWQSKELRWEELEKLARYLLSQEGPLGDSGTLVFLGAGDDRKRNLQMAESLSDSRVVVAETDDSVLRLAGVIRSLDYLVTSDSLALHLAIAQRIPFVAFFAPTSAEEIDDFRLGFKLRSTSADYCSYRKDADNRSITAERIVEIIKLKKLNALNRAPQNLTAA